MRILLLLALGLLGVTAGCKTNTLDMAADSVKHVERLFSAKPEEVDYTGHLDATKPCEPLPELEGKWVRTYATYCIRSCESYAFEGDTLTIRDEASPGEDFPEGRSEVERWHYRIDTSTTPARLKLKPIRRHILTRETDHGTIQFQNHCLWIGHGGYSVTGLSRSEQPDGDAQ